MAVDSHIQIPKGVLRHFTDSSHRVYYLDLKSTHIGLTGAKKLGTEYGYYSDSQEQFLNKEIENPFSLLAAQARRILDDENTVITLKPAAETILKRYITTSMARSDLALKTMQKAMRPYSKLVLSKQQTHDFIATFGAIRDNGVHRIIEKYFLVILVNKTEINWVVPRNCFYGVSSHGYECLVAPISPKCALCLFPPEYAEKQKDSLSYRLGIVNDPDFAFKMNKQALLYEYLYNQTFVASATKSELERLKAHLVESRETLNKLRAEVRKNEMLR